MSSQRALRTIEKPKSRDLARIFAGGDLRMLRGADHAITLVKTQADFDSMFKLLFHHDRRVVMRAADAVEKITAGAPGYLHPHAGQILDLLKDHATIELKWHLAQLIPRLNLNKKNFIEVWSRLKYWALNRGESKIVRVNALQGMFNLMRGRDDKALETEFSVVIAAVSREHIPSLDARVRKLRAALDPNAHRVATSFSPRSDMSQGID